MPRVTSNDNQSEMAVVNPNVVKLYPLKFRDKIPSVLGIENQDKDSEIRDKDKIQKEKGKHYSDLKRKATENTILKGESLHRKYDKRE